LNSFPIVSPMSIAILSIIWWKSFNLSLCRVVEFTFFSFSFVILFFFRLLLLFSSSNLLLLE
jgi:hypothetical protein